MDKEEAIRCQTIATKCAAIARGAGINTFWRVKYQSYARNYAGMARFHMGLEPL